MEPNKLIDKFIKRLGYTKRPAVFISGLDGHSVILKPLDLFMREHISEGWVYHNGGSSKYSEMYFKDIDSLLEWHQYEWSSFCSKHNIDEVTGCHRK